jgi:hypothetical protein
MKTLLLFLGCCLYDQPSHPLLQVGSCGGVPGMDSGASIVVHNTATLEQNRSNKVSESCMVLMEIIVMNCFEALLRVKVWYASVVSQL